MKRVAGTSAFRGDVHQLKPHRSTAAGCSPFSSYKFSPQLAEQLGSHVIPLAQRQPHMCDDVCDELMYVTDGADAWECRMYRRNRTGILRRHQAAYQWARRRPSGSSLTGFSSQRLLFILMHQKTELSNYLLPSPERTVVFFLEASITSITSLRPL